MRRKLFTILAGMSAVLCAALCVMWTRSNATGTVFGYEIDVVVDGSPGWEGSPRISRRSYYLAIDTHSMAYAVYREELFDTPHGWRFFHNDYASGDPGVVAPDLRFFGFEYRSAEYQPTQAAESLREWTVPYWFLVLILAVPPAIAVTTALRARQRRRHGLCPACGYDLRATPDRCPECGVAPSKLGRGG
jgi:hypothetical protein